MSGQNHAIEGRHDSDRRKAVLAGIPLAEHRRQLAGMSTAVLEGGDGPAVVLLHGPGEYAALWARVVPGLLDKHRVVAPDLPGHGATSLPDGRLDAEGVLRWLYELVEQTCPEPPALVGHLIGGAIAMRYAVRHPDRVSRLVLVDTYGLGWNKTSPRFALPLLGFIARPTPQNRDRFLDQCFFDFDGVRAEVDGGFQRYGDYALEWAQDSTAKAALRSLVPAFGVRPLPARIRRGIAVPTTLIWGRHDLQTKLRVAETASRRDGWTLHVIENARDDPGFEQPVASLRALRSALGDA